MINTINPTTIVGGAIAIYEDVWESLAEDFAIISNISSDQDSQIFFSQAKIKSEDFKNVRTNQLLFLTKASDNNAELKYINDKFNKITSECLDNYHNIFKIEEKLFHIEGNSILKYTDSQYYKSHYDGDTSSKRVVSPILYLNDNYEGGEIEFVNFGIKIKPKAGSLLVFPSNYAYRHIAHPVVSGEKYAIVTWIHDR